MKVIRKEFIFESSNLICKGCNGGLPFDWSCDHCTWIQIVSKINFAIGGIPERIVVEVEVNDGKDN